MWSKRSPLEWYRCKPHWGFNSKNSNKSTTRIISNLIIGACIFLDNYTRYSYTHLQTNVDGNHSLEAKQECEQNAASFGAKIKAYYADNGIFAEMAGEERDCSITTFAFSR